MLQVEQRNLCTKAYLALYRLSSLHMLAGSSLTGLFEALPNTHVRCSWPHLQVPRTLLGSSAFGVMLMTSEHLIRRCFPPNKIAEDVSERVPAALLGVLVRQESFGLVHEVQHHAQRLRLQPDAGQQVKQERPRPGEAFPARQQFPGSKKDRVMFPHAKMTSTIHCLP